MLLIMKTHALLKSFTTKHSCEGSKMILCGDFNCNFDKKNDKSNKRLFETINNLDFVDLSQSAQQRY